MLGAVCAWAQAPVVGDINFYGAQKLSPERILNTLKLHPGDRLPGSKADLEDRLSKISGVVDSRVEAVCCDGPRVTLFIGIEERGAPHPAFRSAPAGNAVLPPEMVDAYDGFLAAVASAAAGGHSGEDLSSGHSLMDDPRAWAYQQRFLQMAPANLNLLHEVLRDGSEASQRATAAALIGYAPDKAAIIDDLQYALQDPDAAVRANALRSLTAVAVLASKDPALGLRIEPTWLVELLHSIVLSDRVESLQALLALTNGTAGHERAAQHGQAAGETNERAALDLIRERALPSVIQMARWKTPGDALPAFLLAGRLAGMDYVDTLQQWATGNHDAVLAKVLSTGRKKAGGTLQ